MFCRLYLFTKMDIHIEINFIWDIYILKFRQIYLSIWTYIWQFRQIHFAIGTNTFWQARHISQSRFSFQIHILLSISLNISVSLSRSCLWSIYLQPQSFGQFLPIKVFHQVSQVDWKVRFLMCLNLLLFWPKSCFGSCAKFSRVTNCGKYRKVLGGAITEVIIHRNCTNITEVHYFRKHSPTTSSKLSTFVKTCFREIYVINKYFLFIPST